MDEINRIIAALICIVGLHPWSKWSEAKKAQNSDDTGQERTCSRCGRHQWRWLHRVGKCTQHKWAIHERHDIITEGRKIPHATQFIHRCTICGEMKKEQF